MGTGNFWELLSEELYVKRLHVCINNLQYNSGGVVAVLDATSRGAMRCAIII